ncbi:hypothetical protein GCM10009555_075290 [Acrocarpospora macrocephala]|uniref:Uncharacterized protein n=1 Tax=Acrocarpospora macrocephala TaxID=150177 RepID=A0A5M3X0B1_9ACTN|nr:hypothetical protein [Acrocarpospora macrocephala]GES14490.1 hypothetical protein Amac_080870 [Acrocarpospora macrocephala]
MTDLEARYRRLLRWYPQAHRAVHEEEMLGVLMAGAEPGRTRPKVAESADLIRGAARIRLRHAFGPESGPSWRSAFALAGLVATLVLACELVPQSLFLFWNGYFWAPATAFGLALALVAVLILRAPRWLAAGAAWAWAAGYLAWSLPQVLPLDFSDMYSFSSSQPLPVVLQFAPVVLVAVLVTLRPDRPVVPYRKVLGWSALLVGAGLPQLYQFENWFYETIGSLGYETEAILFMLPLTVLAVLAGQAARTATGRRTIVLAAVPVLLMTGYDLLVLWMTGSWLFGSLGLLIPAVIMFVLARRGKPVPQTPVPG